MTVNVGAAIRITSPGQARVIEHAAAYAKREAAHCFVFSVVHELPYGVESDEERDVVERNLKLIADSEASPVMQQGHDVAKTLIALAQGFGIRTLFLQSGGSQGPGRTVAEQLLHLDPPFDVVVVGSE